MYLSTLRPWDSNFERIVSVEKLEEADHQKTGDLAHSLLLLQQMVQGSSSLLSPTLSYPSL